MLMFVKNYRIQDEDRRSSLDKRFRQYSRAVRYEDTADIEASPLVDISAYALMDNHFHVLLSPVEEHEDVTVFMHSVCTAYSVYFNKKYKKSGSVFGSRFQSKDVDTSDYYESTVAYIHNNPLKLLMSALEYEQIRNINPSILASNDASTVSYHGESLGVSKAPRTSRNYKVLHHDRLSDYKYSSYIDFICRQVSASRKNLRKETSILVRNFLN